MKARLQAGLTLIEVVIYIGLFAMLLVSAVLMLNYVFLIKTKVKTATVVQDGTNYAMSLIGQMVSESSEIELPATGTSAYLKLRSVDAGNDPTVVQLENGQLMISRGSSEPDWLTPAEIEITDFSITRLTVDPPIIRINASAVYRNSPYPYDATYTTAISASTY